MTFQRASMTANEYAEKEMMAYWSEIARIYHESSTKINTELRDFYAKVLSGINPDDYWNEAIKADRFVKLQTRTNAIYTRASLKAGENVLKSNRTAFISSYSRNSYVLDFFSGNAGVKLQFVPFNDLIAEYGTKINIQTWRAIQEAGLTRKALTGASGESGTLVNLLTTWRVKEIQQINQAVQTGLFRGSNYSTIARQIRGVIGVDGTQGAAYKALRIAQTEGTKLLNAGNFMASLSAQEQGLEMEKRWNSLIDSQTRDAHADADGQTVPLNEPFIVDGEAMMYPGSGRSAENVINCRCGYVDQIKGVSPEIRGVKNPDTGQYEYFEWANYRDFEAGNARRIA